MPPNLLGQVFTNASVDNIRPQPFVHNTQRIQSNKIEPKINRTQSNTNRSIGFGNRTKSNIYFAVSSIFEPIEHNRTQSGSILFGIQLLISKSRRTNHNQPLLHGINRKTSKYRTECQCSVIYIL